MMWKLLRNCLVLMKYIFTHGDNSRNVYTAFDIDSFVVYFKLMQFLDKLQLKSDESYDAPPSAFLNRLNDKNQSTDHDLSTQDFLSNWSNNNNNRQQSRFNTIQCRICSDKKHPYWKCRIWRHLKYQ